VHTVFGKNDRNCFPNHKFVATAAWNLTQQNKFGFVDLDGHRIEIRHCKADARAFAAAPLCALSLFGHRRIHQTKWCKTVSDCTIQKNWVAKRGLHRAVICKLDTDTYEHSDL